MRKLIKITSLILSIICLSAVPVMADEIEYTPPQPFYLSFTGTVNEIEKVDDVITQIYLEDKDGVPAQTTPNKIIVLSQQLKDLILLKI